MPPSDQGRSSSSSTMPKATVLICTGTGTTVSPSSERASFGRVDDDAALGRDLLRFAVVGGELLGGDRLLGGVVQLRVHRRRSSCVCQASAKWLAASFSGDPGTPMAAPTTKATTAITPSGTARVSSRLRRSTSGDCLLTAGKVIERSAACLYSVGDRARLGDHRLHARPRALGVSPGADRRRADPGRLRRRCLPRLAARPDRPLPGRRFALRAALRSDRGAPGRGAGGGDAGGDGAGAAAAADPPSPVCTAPTGRAGRR